MVTVFIVLFKQLKAEIIMDNSNCDQGSLRPMMAGDLASILLLRNHDEIRRYMLTQHKISINEHTLWFDKASKNPSTELLVFEIKNKCFGFVQFKESSNTGIVDWGFYVDPDAPKGVARRMAEEALRTVFKKKGIYKVCGRAFDWNESSINFHKSLGFAQEGVLRDHHFDGLSYHSLICFGLLKRNCKVREKFNEEKE